MARVLSVAQLQAAHRAGRARPYASWLALPPANPAGVDASCLDAAGDDTPSVALALPAGWVAVVGAAPGVGASTVALAIADAAASRGPVHLIDTAAPSRSGLVGAPCAELGVDEAGGWRRGTRGPLLIDRPAGQVRPAYWPVEPGDPWSLTVVDAGLARASIGSLPARTVLVCRATVPGVARAERLLATMPAAGALLVAAVGPRRWPRPVLLVCGPHLRALRRAGQVVAVPLDRRLEVTGLTSRPLPRRVHAAGRHLAVLLDAAPNATPADGRPGADVASGRRRREPADLTLTARGNAGCDRALAGAAGGRS